MRTRHARTAPNAPGARRPLDRMVGRHLQLLDLTADLPPWIPRAWKRQTGTPWRFRGPGYVLVNEEGFLAVLVEAVDTAIPGLRITFDEDAANRYGTVRRQTYDGSFQVMETRPGAQVVARFDLGLTDAGRKKMRGIPAGRSPRSSGTVRPGHSPTTSPGTSRTSRRSRPRAAINGFRGSVPGSARSTGTTSRRSPGGCTSRSCSTSSARRRRRRRRPRRRLTGQNQPPTTTLSGWRVAESRKSGLTQTPAARCSNAASTSVRQNA